MISIWLFFIVVGALLGIIAALIMIFVVPEDKEDDFDDLE
jgi:phage shock protein PspC (stress-responsive transcriptional regulator)